MNPMYQVRVEKVVVHMGVGESGEKLTKATDILRTITGQTPVKNIARNTVPAFGIRRGAPIGCRVTLRGDTAEQFLKTALGIVENRISASQFDANGNFAFGIEEHTDFPGMAYDPKIGIYGMDVNVVLARNGVRICRRHIERRKLPAQQHANREDAIVFLSSAYGLEVR